MYKIHINALNNEYNIKIFTKIFQSRIERMPFVEIICKKIKKTIVITT